MPVEQNFKAFQKSISRELEATQNRIRDLIGSSHWQTDGEHKESILRNTLKNHVPETVRVGTGFVCFPSANLEAENEDKRRASSQIDVLVTSIRNPTLYKEGDLVFVTAEAVRAIIEVKTNLRSGRSRQSLFYVLNRLADEAERIRSYFFENENCWVGLFVFNTINLSNLEILGAVQRSSKGMKQRAINVISLGRHHFIRYWDKGSVVKSPVKGPVWHLYHLKDLAPTYFIGNLVVRLSPEIPNFSLNAWFPVPGTKEQQREAYVPLQGTPIEFSENDRWISEVYQ